MPAPAPAGGLARRLSPATPPASGVVRCNPERLRYGNAIASAAARCGGRGGDRKHGGCSDSCERSRRIKMGKERAADDSFFNQLWHLRVYKRNQGVVARQVTFAFLALIFAIAALRMYQSWGSFPSWWKTALTDVGRYGVPSLMLLLGLWFSFHIVNFPRFADFLISVEGEMNKVSWPSKGELIRSSIVVIMTIVILAVVLFFFDVFWRFVFGDRFLGVLD
jgi:preprotein translocase subunit SecE